MLKNNNKLINYKYVLVGDSATGKSSIASRYISNHFYEFQEPTIGASFLSKKISINDKEYKLEIWDTAGQERYRSLAPMYYRNASAALIVYDITKKDSFIGAKTWINELKKKSNIECLLILIGNKCDLEKYRKINKEEVNKFVEEEDIQHIEVSAKTGENINYIFENTINILIENNNEGIINNSRLIKEDNSSYSKCCQV